MKRKILTVMALLALVALTLCGCADTRVDENQNTPERSTLCLFYSVTFIPKR